MYQAQVAQLALEAEGIRTSLENETIVSMDWFLSNAVGGIKLQVAAEDAATATRILNEIRANAKEREASQKLLRVVFRCNGCKRVVSMPAITKGRVETCPKCGRYVDVPAESDETLAESLAREGSKNWNWLSAIFRFTSSQSKAYLIAELLIVLLVAFLPDLANSTQIFWNITANGQQFHEDVADSLALVLVRSTFVVILMCVLLAISRTDPATWGLRLSHFWKQAGLGVVVALGLVAFDEIISRSTGTSAAITTAGWPNFEKVSPVAFALAATFCLLANSLAEEIVMRGYLISRLEKLCGLRWWTVLLPAVMFASYHLYQGYFGVISAAITGLVFGFWFVMSRNLTGVIVAHTLINMSWLFSEWCFNRGE